MTYVSSGKSQTLNLGWQSMTTWPDLNLCRLYIPGSKNASPFLGGGTKKEEHFVTHEKSRGIQIPPSTDKVLLVQQPYPLGSLLSELSTWVRHHPASTPKMRILCPTAGKTC